MSDKHVFEKHLFFVSICVRIWHGACVEVRGQFAGVGFCLSSCGFQGLNSDYPSWQQAPLSTGPSCQSINLFLYLCFKLRGIYCMLGGKMLSVWHHQPLCCFLLVFVVLGLEPRAMLLPSQMLPAASLGHSCFLLPGTQS